MKKYTITNMKFDNLIRVLYNVIHFLYETRDVSNYHYITDYVILLQKTARIIDKINDCDETSATKCFTCVNEIKDLINRSNLLWVKNPRLKNCIIKKEKRR